MLWGDTLLESATVGARSGEPALDYIADTATPAQKLDALAAVVARLGADFGDWRTPWGELNRFQRLDDATPPRFDDAAPSTAVPFTSSQWGSLAAFGARRYPVLGSITARRGTASSRPWSSGRACTPAP